MTRHEGPVPEGQVSHRNANRMGVLVGARIERVTSGPQVSAQRMDSRLEGQVVEDVQAVGKHHVIRFAGGLALHSHLGMHGSWRLFPADRTPPQGGLWLAMWTRSHVAVQYRGSRLRLYEPHEPIPALAQVGPDLLDPARDPAATMTWALTLADPGRAVGDALLDQRLVSGLGNVYRAETMFLCQVDPWRTCASLTPQETAALGVTGAELLAHGVDHPGPITTYHDSRPGSRERTWVYGRRGRPCRRCGTPIRSRGMGDANRTLYWCPVCQT